MKITKEQLSNLLKDNFEEITMEEWGGPDTNGQGYGRAFYDGKGISCIYFKPKSSGKKIKLIPYREIDNPDVDSFDTVYEFLIQGTFTEPYSVLISVDNFNNDGKHVDHTCNCKDFEIRRVFPEACKHIEACLEILEQDGKITLFDEQID